MSSALETSRSATDRFQYVIESRPRLRLRYGLDFARNDENG